MARAETHGSRERVAALVVLAIAGTMLGTMAQALASPDGTPTPLAGGPRLGWIPDVAVSASSASSSYSPAIATAPNGDLYATWIRVVDGKGQVEFARSGDGGMTWSSPALVAGPADDEEWPAIAVDAYSGRAYIAFYASLRKMIEVAWSDGGSVWTAVDVFDCRLGGPGAECGRPNLAVEYANGEKNRAYVTFELQFGGAENTDVFVFRSSNGGWSWTQVLDEGLGSNAVYLQPAITTQRGKDGKDRVIVFYRSGSSYASATDGMITWSENHGDAWKTPVRWTPSAALPPAIAAARDGSSLLVTTGSAYNADVDWYGTTDPTNLGTVTAFGTWTGFGYSSHLTADGDGAEDAPSGGFYHVVAARHPGVNYRSVAEDFSSFGAVEMITDQSAAFTGADRDFDVTTNLRGGVWWASVLWADFRNQVTDSVWYSTPGARITVATDPPGLAVMVGDYEQTAPFTTPYPAGTLVSVGAPSPQPIYAGARHSFSAWSDGGAGTHGVSMGTIDLTVVASFVTEYAATIDSSPPGLLVLFGGSMGTTPATFWVQAGDYLADATSPQPIGADTRFRFARWSDAGAQAHLVGVGGPMTLTATFVAQYKLTVLTAHGVATGAGWYDAGSTVFISVPETVVEGGKTWHFDGWSRDAFSPQAGANVRMDAPKTVEATWREELPAVVTAPTSIHVLLLPVALVFLLLLIAVLLVVFGGLVWRWNENREREPVEPALPDPPPPEDVEGQLI